MMFKYDNDFCLPLNVFLSRIAEQILTPKHTCPAESVV